MTIQGGQMEEAPKTGFVDIYPSKDGGWRFRIRGLNGEPVAYGESYTEERSAHKGVDVTRIILKNPEVRVYDIAFTDSEEDPADEPISDAEVQDVLDAIPADDANGSDEIQAHGVVWPGGFRS